MSDVPAHPIATATGAYDLADPADHARVRSLADGLLDADLPEHRLAGIGRDPATPFDLRLATMVARSRRAVLQSGWEGRLAIVFAMWGEQRRLRPRTNANPAGEDALHVKLDQLRWLFDGTGVDWWVLPVDDGDPDDSAAVADERAAVHPDGSRVEVLRLGDVVPTDDGPLAGLAHVDDSRKGGAIVHGAACALAEQADAVLVTDADNSVDWPRRVSSSPRSRRAAPGPWSATASTPTPSW